MGESVRRQISYLWGDEDDEPDTPTPMAVCPETPPPVCAAERQFSVNSENVRRQIEFVFKGTRGDTLPFHCASSCAPRANWRVRESHRAHVVVIVFNCTKEVMPQEHKHSQSLRSNVRTLPEVLEHLK